MMVMTCMCSRIEKAKHGTDSVAKDHSHGNTGIKMMMMVVIMMMMMMTMIVMMMVIIIFIIGYPRIIPIVTLASK